MMKNKKFFFIFFLIFIIAAALRFYKLTDIPPGVNRDEASIGYTAYSILKTGKDEYGRSFPISFQSFGDWKLPLYMYATVPFVALFGPSELSVRLLSALVGLATVGLTFFLVKQLFQNTTLAFLTMFLLAISPWHLHLSRVESESNTAVFLIVLAVLLFLKSIKGRSWLIILSLSFFALSYFTYAGNYIFTTLLTLGIFLICKSAILKTKYFLMGIILFTFLFGFISSQTIFANKTKLSGISIFSDPAIVHVKIELPRNEHVNPQSIYARLMHNRVIFALERFSQNYINAFSTEFLFIKGGENKAHNISNFGNMYLVEAPFFFLGIVYLLTLKKSREKKLVLFWILIAPIAASITKDAPHTNRMLAIFPILPLVTAMGIYYLLTSLKKPIFKKLAIGVMAIGFVINILLYFDRYYVHFPRDEAENWGLGYKKLSDILQTERFKNKRVVITKPESSPYIFLLFYQKYDPQKYQESAVRYPPTEDKFVHVKSFDRFEFRTIDWGKDSKKENQLLIDMPINIPVFIKNSYSHSEIILPNNEPMFTIVETE